MRPVLIGDVTEAARALRAVPPAARRALAEALIAEACAADRHRRTHRRLPRTGGDGSLMAAARARPQAPPLARLDPAACAALIDVLHALLRREAGAGL
ncbi:hypothetical protein GCM10011392_15990 [Wenxinia marina]|uniref:DUF7742 family protein n=1 Tax=Wenxinia marina TaxID=390641 RepID=UPI00036416A6|nr:hypothetical protein [Wenxinia marina]GGL62227.1 hypothetical protein GCM10011392_15990 [Wenxinia marina]